jgi:hypothetical protein
MVKMGQAIDRFFSIVVAPMNPAEMNHSKHIDSATERN